MKILHLADTHIGYSAYNKLDENGINQREVDVYNAFNQIVDFAIEKKVDLVLHSGDLFDTVRPSNRAISFVVGQLLRLSNAGIPTVIISGNHETPRLRETGTVFKVFEHIDGLHLAYTGKCQTFEFNEIKVHALPHCADKERFETELDAMKPDKKFKFNIAMLHSAVSGLAVFRMNEFNELIAQDSQLNRGWDYVALGHYHEPCEVGSNIVYAGSTEKYGFGHVNQPNGFVMLDTEKGKWKFHDMKIRPMLDLRTIDCNDMKADDIASAIQSNVNKANIEGAIVRQKLQDIDRRELGLLDMTFIHKITKDALHFELRPAAKEAGQKVASQDAAFDSLEREFITYLAKIVIEGADPKEIEALGLRYLAGGET
ncbi:MAG: DNA repair exonuclease [Thermoplasmata archaeon]|nr:DNA repair exonuclease [Thermoplasmata archaeon]